MKGVRERAVFAGVVACFSDGRMSETTVTSADSTVVDVLTNSSTGYAGAWFEDDFDWLLDAWQMVVEEVRSPKRRSDAPFKVLKYLQRKGFRKVSKEEVRRQMNVLCKEYRTYLGLNKMRIPTVKANCVPKLEKILGPPIWQLETKEEGHSQRVTSKEFTIKSAKQTVDCKENLDVAEIKDEEGGNKQLGSQGRTNTWRLVQLQESMLSHILELQKAKDQAEANIQQLLQEIVDLYETFLTNQKIIIEALEGLKI